MENRNEKKEILNGIFNQIASFDNKANILIQVMGIVFAISISFLTVASDEVFKLKGDVIKICYNVLFILFTINMIIAVLLFILVIFPRKHRDNITYANYYYDIYSLSKEEFNSAFNEYIKDDNRLSEQIIINASVCRYKHRYLTLGIIALIPASILLLTLIFILVL